MRIKLKKGMYQHGVPRIWHSVASQKYNELTSRPFVSGEEYTMYFSGGWMVL